MKRYLLDTGSASDLINRRGPIQYRVHDVLVKGSRVGIGAPVLGELLAGIELSQSREKNRVILLRAVRLLVVWPFDSAAAEVYGRLFAELRRVGRPMQQVVIQVASIALSLGSCMVVTKDRDLFAVPGLAVDDWS